MLSVLQKKSECSDTQGRSKTSNSLHFRKIKKLSSESVREFAGQHSESSNHMWWTRNHIDQQIPSLIEHSVGHVQNQKLAQLKFILWNRLNLPEFSHWAKLNTHRKSLMHPNQKLNRQFGWSDVHIIVSETTKVGFLRINRRNNETEIRIKGQGRTFPDTYSLVKN